MILIDRIKDRTSSFGRLERKAGLAVMNRKSENLKIWKSKIRHIRPSGVLGRTESESLKNWKLRGPEQFSDTLLLCVVACKYPPGSLDPSCLLWGLLCCLLCLLAGVLWCFVLFVVLCVVHSVVCVELKQSSLICLCSSVVGRNADT